MFITPLNDVARLDRSRFLDSGHEMMLGKLLPVQGGEPVRLTKPTVIVGRGDDCDVVISHHSVAPSHCTFEYRDGRWFVEDHGTTTGVRVNGDRFDNTLVPVYSVVSIGTVEFELHYRAGAPLSQEAEVTGSGVWPSLQSSGSGSEKFDAGGPTGSPAASRGESPDCPMKRRFKRYGSLIPRDGSPPFPLLDERVYLGRDEDCDVVLPNMDIAPIHCVMEFHDGFWHVRNLRSNGVLIDGESVREGLLTPGSVLTVARQELEVDYKIDKDTVLSEQATTSSEDEGFVVDGIEESMILSPDALDPEAEGDCTAAGTGTGEVQAESQTGKAEAPAGQEEVVEPENSQGGESPEGEVPSDIDGLVIESSNAEFLLDDDLDESLMGVEGDDESDFLWPDSEGPELDLPGLFSDRRTVAEASVDAPEEASLDDSSVAGQSEQTTRRTYREADQHRPARDIRRKSPEETRRTESPSKPPSAPASSPDRSPVSAAGRTAPQQSAVEVVSQLPEAPAGMDFRAADDSDADSLSREAVVASRHRSIARFLESHGLDSLLITQPGNFAWFTAGGDSRLGSAEPVGALLITPETRTVVCRAGDASFMMDGQLGGAGIELSACHWPENIHETAEELCRGRRVASDEPTDGQFDAAADLAAARLPLSKFERRELRRLGHQVVHAVEATLQNFRHGESEASIAGQLANRLIRYEIIPECIQVHADERRNRHQRWRYSREPVEDSCTLSVTAQRNGLHVATSRTMSFGQPSEAMTNAHAASLAIQSTAMFYSKQRWYMADTWKRVERIYRKLAPQIGDPDGLKVADHGSVTGYRTCEHPILPDSNLAFSHGMPIIWKQSIGSALSVDTMLVARGGFDIVTPIESWPTFELSIKGVTLQRPNILVRPQQ